jgi:hypothetical protein
MISGPRPHPRPNALLEIGNDRVGDFAVNIPELGHFVSPLEHEEQRVLFLCPSARPG